MAARLKSAAIGLDQLNLVNGSERQEIDCSDSGLSSFLNLASDIPNRTEAVLPHDSAFNVLELAFQAKMIADGVWGDAEQ